MRDIHDTVTKIYTLTRCDPRRGGGKQHRTPAAHERYLVEKIHAEVYDLLVDQLLSVANALAPDSDEEVRITNWLQTKLASIAEQLPKPTEHK